MDSEPTPAARLSRMLFTAQENLEMWADVVEARTESTDDDLRSLIDDIAAYRAEEGWSPDGYGGETTQPPSERVNFRMARWPWQQCRSRTGAVDETPRGVRCDLLHGHPTNHAAERGMYWIVWSKATWVDL